MTERLKVVDSVVVCESQKADFQHIRLRAGGP